MQLTSGWKIKITQSIGLGAGIIQVVVEPIAPCAGGIFINRVDLTIPANKNKSRCYGLWLGS